MKTSIIICTYNEERTIADVVTACCIFNPDHEIIVVDDGSTDNTENILIALSQLYIFRYEKLKENMGKSWAMAHGIEISENEIILFFDADVSNIKKEHFDNLLNPLLEGTADMVLGQPSETLIDYRVNPFKALTGERSLLKNDVIPVLDDIRDIRFGIETFLNLYYQSTGKRIKYVLMKDLKHPSTYQKSDSLAIATKKYIKEGQDIAKTVIKNHDLINKRVELLINKANTNAKNKINSIQKDINIKLQEIRERLN